MDLRFTPEEIAFRHEVRSFLRSALPPSIGRKMILEQRITKDDLVTWQRILNAKGWAAPMWSEEWGGTGWNAMQQYIFVEELQQTPAPMPLSQNIALVGPVIIAFGSQAQKEFFLPKLRNLDYWFSQGFSEPGAGSDLAGLATRAVRDGDHYLVTGQKIWTSMAHHADWGFFLVRTDANSKRQKGVSFLLIDMKSPGITIRPIVTLDGFHHTNEVFLDNVRVPVANRIGEEHNAWKYVKYLLGHERTTLAKVGSSRARVIRAREVAERLIVDGKPLGDQPRFREKLAAIEVELKALKITTMRVVDDQRKNLGTSQDPKGSILKLRGSEIEQALNELFVDMAGPHMIPRQLDHLLAKASEPTIGPDWAATTAASYFFLRAATIYGGSSEVQHNIISKAVLGL